MTNRNPTETVTQLAMGASEAAKALGISERKLWEIKADLTSGLPFVQVGRRVVFPVRELRDWLAAQIVEGRR